MEKLLFAAGTSFLRAFAVTFLSFAAGILGATNVSSGTALSIAALAASVAAGLRSLQVFIPKLTVGSLLAQPWGAYADAFIRAFLATFVVTAAGWLAAPNWSDSKAALYGALTGAAVAAVRALQGLVTPGESPAPANGIAARS